MSIRNLLNRCNKSYSQAPTFEELKAEFDHLVPVAKDKNFISSFVDQTRDPKVRFVITELGRLKLKSI